MGLNHDQEKAALHLSGALLIEAGAGSGKTRTLAHRCANAVVKGRVEGWQPAAVDEIAAITFTEKAAGELAERVRRALRAEGARDEARRVDAAWMGTIHGMCSRILRRHALDAGIDPYFSVLDGTESHSLQEKAFEAAAEELTAESDDVRTLLDTHGFEPVFASVRSLLGDVASGAELVTEGEPDVEAALSRTADALRKALAGFGTCQDAGATSNVTACEAALEALDALPADGPALRAAAAWKALSTYDARKATAKVSSPVREGLLLEIAPAVEDLTVAATTPLARALCSLASNTASRYSEMKRQRAALDFDDQQRLAADLLERSPAVAERMRRDMRLVMVDEAQDTDALQLRIARAVAGEQLCLVGDGRQSIYGFRGADVEAYREQRRQMLEAGAREVRLAANYRSHAELLAFVNRLFGDERVFGDELVRLEHARDESTAPALPRGEPRVEIVLAETATEGARPAIAGLIAARFAELRDRGIPSSEMVVLLRSYTNAAAYADALEAAGLPAAIVGGRRFFGRPEVAIARALCLAIANPADDEALTLVLASVPAGLSDTALWRLRNGAPEPASSMWDALAAAEQMLDGADLDAAVRLRGAIGRATERAGALPLGEVLLRAVEECGWDLRILEDGKAGSQGYANLLKLARMADAFEAAGGAGAAAFVADLDARQRLGEHQSPAVLVDDASPAVRVMSIHAAKGLEFTAVAVVGLAEGTGGRAPIARVRREPGRAVVSVRLPSPKKGVVERMGRTPLFEELERTEDAAAAEETLRLFYVACTRAKDRLLLAGCGAVDECGDGPMPLHVMRRVLGLGKVPAEGVPELDLGGGARARVTVLPHEEPVAEDAPEPDGDEMATGEPETAEEPVLAPEAVPAMPESLAYTDLSLFAACPLRFKAEKLMCLTRAADAVEDPPWKRLGVAVHAALSLPAEAVDEARLAAIARFHGLDDEARAAFEVLVSAFRRSPLAARLGGSALSEVPFALQVGEHADPLLLVGTIDALVEEGARALIVDYKTGAVTPDEAPGEYELQARCYALAALRAGAEEVECAFALLACLGEDDLPSQVTFTYRAEDASAIEEELLDVRRRMVRGEYGPSQPGRHCEGCPVRGTLCQREEPE